MSLCYQRAIGEDGAYYHCTKPVGHDGACQFERTLTIRAGTPSDEADQPVVDLNAFTLNARDPEGR
jgi:hypothetical protein